MDSQKETRTRDFGFRGCGGVLLLDRWGAQSTHVVRGCFGPPPGTEAVEGGGLLRGGRRSAVHGQHGRHGQVSSLLRTEAQRSARRGSHAPLLPCSRVQPVNWPQVPEDAGHGRCSAVAAARCSAGEHRTATVLDYRLRLYTEVSTLCCGVTRAIWGGKLREAGESGRRARCHSTQAQHRVEDRAWAWARACRTVAI